jgi:hypothetical protein
MNEIPERSLASPSNPAIAALIAADLGAVLMPPDRVGLPSSWWGHVPFAHWLVRELKPRLAVELGTAHGISFSAFCNAVRRDGLATRCYAVDTWQGDEHAGFYDESVFNGIDASVQQNYSSFATLLRRSFDSALGLFAEGSIDLLHIDGLHTYEAVKADFEAWSPKLSDRGVVLFHDTAIHERGFGVWRFWKEISQRHPSFEFHHSCGLGVLAPGGAVPDFISALVGLEPAVAATLRERLADLGERWISVDERARAAVEIDALKQQLRVTQEASASLREEFRARSEAVATRTAGLALEGDTLRQQLAMAAGEADRLRLQLEQVRTSTSWRVTGPYRIAGRLLKRHVLAPLVARPSERQRLRDFKRIASSNAFNAAFYLGRACAPGEEEDAIIDYLAASGDRVPRGRQKPGAPLRRPMLGFHPLAYAEQRTEYDETTGEDPLAHYLRTGTPDGPWKHGVIPARTPSPPAGGGQRILIHAHFHYPDLLGDLLRRLGSNPSAADLFVTTTSEAKAAEIETTLKPYNGKVTIVVTPNLGRDIGPLLMHFASFGDYDIVGHMHGKRSPQQSGTQGENWRAFLWDHLIGGGDPMMDVIAEAFAADERLGLVFPEDPNLNHWDMNQSLAKGLADRLTPPRALPAHFEFPKGTMFWFRPAALRPLADLGWRWEDFPGEPVASDGTVLHALERLIAFSAEAAGFGFRTVHVPGSWRSPTLP